MFHFAKLAINGLLEDWRREADFRELSALNDHLLADIGLRRDQLETLRLKASLVADAPDATRAPVYRPELVHCG